MCSVIPTIFSAQNTVTMLIILDCGHSTNHYVLTAIHFRIFLSFLSRSLSALALLSLCLSSPDPAPSPTVANACGASEFSLWKSEFLLIRT